MFPLGPLRPISSPPPRRPPSETRGAAVPQYFNRFCCLDLPPDESVSVRGLFVCLSLVRCYGPSCPPICIFCRCLLSAALAPARPRRGGPSTALTRIGRPLFSAAALCCSSFARSGCSPLPRGAVFCSVRRHCSFVSRPQRRSAHIVALFPRRVSVSSARLAFVSPVVIALHRAPPCGWPHC